MHAHPHTPLSLSDWICNLCARNISLWQNLAARVRARLCACPRQCNTEKQFDMRLFAAQMIFHAFNLALNSPSGQSSGNRAALDISLYDRFLRSIATPRREAEIIGFIKQEPNKTLAFMPRYESAVWILLFHNTIPHQHTAHGSSTTYKYKLARLHTHTRTHTRGGEGAHTDTGAWTHRPLQL